MGQCTWPRKVFTCLQAPATYLPALPVSPQSRTPNPLFRGSKFSQLSCLLPAALARPPRRPLPPLQLFIHPFLGVLFLALLWWRHFQVKPSSEPLMNPTGVLHLTCGHSVLGGTWMTQWAGIPVPQWAGAEAGWRTGGQHLVFATKHPFLQVSRESYLSGFLVHVL